ncbi:MAG TPA: HNH endonuclease [Candidatus Tripitaka californicus]|uniref:HNH endonuclease n=1 Tax=Candidatus Tripitaka californicus TaxID=3367616 RepID=UPI0040289C27|nr:HNH endonuclease [Planctomycetota bacterium]
MAISINDLILEYFHNHPNQDLQHGPVVDWVEEQYLKLCGRKPRDTWRAIRKLHQEGKLIKVKKGVYRYDPVHVKNIKLLDFPPDVKEEIFKRDKYQCVWCGRGPKDGVEICADHKKSKDLGGDNSVDNGQTLCTEHNLLKKNYSQSEAGKKYFINLYKTAVSIGDEKMINFCKSIFDCYEEHEINGQIPRPNGQK